MRLTEAIQLYMGSPAKVLSFPDAVISMTEDLEVKFWNSGAEFLFQYGHEEAIGQQLKNLIWNQPQPFVLEGISRSLELFQEWRSELLFAGKNGQPFHCLASLSRIERQDQIEVLLILKDISEQKEFEQRIREKESQLQFTESQASELRQLLDRVTEGYFSFDREWRYTFVNEKACAMLGRTAESLIGKQVWEEFPAFKTGPFYDLLMQAMKSNRDMHAEEYSALWNKWFSVDIYPTTEGLSVFYKDLTQVKRVEEQLLQQEKLYQDIVETVQEGILITDDKGIISFSNPVTEKMLGFDKSEMVGRHINEFLPNALPDHDDTDGAPGVRKQFDYKLKKKSGKNLWMLIRTTPMYRESTFAGTLTLLLDITERKVKERQLEQSHTQLRALTRRLHEVREEERSKIAKEIHDDLGQQLTALKMDAYTLNKLVGKSNVEAQAQIRKIVGLLTETLSKIEKKSLELHPNILDNLGLLAAIEWQNREFSSRFKIPIAFETTGSDTGLNGIVALNIYRIYQETLTNIARHADASKITTSFANEDGTTRLVVKDNGKGFDMAIVGKTKSLGLVSMKERCLTMGGEFSIQTAAGRGTEVKITINKNKTA